MTTLEERFLLMYDEITDKNAYLEMKIKELEAENKFLTDNFKKLVETLGEHATRAKNSWDRYDVIGFYNFENNPNNKKTQEKYEYISKVFAEYPKKEEDSEV